MLQATCSPTGGEWSIKAAHTAHQQQGGGMGMNTFSQFESAVKAAISQLFAKEQVQEEQFEDGAGI